jgi:hypothetical protein
MHLNAMLWCGLDLTKTGTKNKLSAKWTLIRTFAVLNLGSGTWETTKKQAYPSLAMIGGLLLPMPWSSPIPGSSPIPWSFQSFNSALGISAGVHALG